MIILLLESLAIIVCIYFVYPLIWSVILIPAADYLIVVDVLLGEHRTAFWRAAHRVGVEGASAFALWGQIPAASEVHSLCFAAAVAIERPLPVVAHAVPPLELMPAFPASQSVYGTHESIKYEDSID